MAHATIKQAVLAAKEAFLEFFGDEYNAHQFNFNVITDENGDEYEAAFENCSGMVTNDLYTWLSDDDSQKLFDNIEKMTAAELNLLIDTSIAKEFNADNAKDENE